jgi:hypothetical protein
MRTVVDPICGAMRRAAFDAGPTHRHRCLQLCARREQAANFADRLAELRFTLVEHDLGIGWIEVHQRLTRLYERGSSAPIAMTVPAICGVICTTLPLT